ncbi:hypothetical protein [Ruania albidiflava]|uniref:hypothetical protein n=1 Tax=Ruania albidiflava TaxID=366586 RepID=UPI0003B6D3E4|nr:hypothetical protein [Ruania albidiflava]
MRSTASRRRSSPREHPLPWAVLAVVLVVAGVLAAPPRPQPVTDPWGYVPTLGDEPEEAWALPGSFENLWVFARAVVVAGPGGITAPATHSGRELWTIEADEPRCTSGGLQLTCVTGADLVQTIDPRTGSTEDWSVPTAVAAAAVGGGLVAVTARDIRRIAADGQVQWASEAVFARTLQAGPAVLDGAVLASAIGQSAPGVLLDADTGAELVPEGARAAVTPVREGLWRAQHADTTRLYSRGQDVRSVRGPVSWMVTAADPDDIRELEPKEDRRWLPFAFLPSATLGFEASREHGPGVLIAEDPASRAEQWRLADVQLFGAPILGPHTLLYSDTTQLRAVDLDTGRLAWAIDPGAPILKLTSDGDRLYLLTENGISTWTW